MAMEDGTNYGDANECHRWSPEPSVAAVHGLGGPSMAAAGGTIVGELLVV